MGRDEYAVKKGEGGLVTEKVLRLNLHLTSASKFLSAADCVLHALPRLKIDPRDAVKWSHMEKYM